MKIERIGESLHWSYANLAMAHAAVTNGCSKYDRIHFMIRSKLFKGLQTGSMSIGPLAEDEKLKLVIPQACCYCGTREQLSVDHLIARKRGGLDEGDNMVWSCRSCNSSKGAKDVVEWLGSRDLFPPILLLRRYLKLAIDYGKREMLMDSSLTDAPADIPFSLGAIPHNFPAPDHLVLWIVPI